MFPSFPSNQWEFQDPKLEVLYHIRPYFVVIFTYIGLKNRIIGLIYGRYLQFRYLKWPSFGHVFFEKLRMAIPPTSAAPWFADTARSNGRPVPAGCPHHGGDLGRSYGDDMWI